MSAPRLISVRTCVFLAADFERFADEYAEFEDLKECFRKLVPGDLEGLSPDDIRVKMLCTYEIYEGPGIGGGDLITHPFINLGYLEDLVSQRYDGDDYSFDETGDFQFGVDDRRVQDILGELSYGDVSFISQGRYADIEEAIGDAVSSLADLYYVGPM